MDANQQGHEHGEGDSDVQQTQQGAQPPGRDAEQREGGGVAESEALPHGEVDDKPSDPCPVGVFGDQGAEDEGQVEAAEAAELRGDHDDGQQGGGHQPEQRPACPVHRGSAS